MIHPGSTMPGAMATGPSAITRPFGILGDIMPAAWGSRTLTGTGTWTSLLAVAMARQPITTSLLMTALTTLWIQGLSGICTIPIPMPWIWPPATSTMMAGWTLWRMVTTSILASTSMMGWVGLQRP